MDIFNVLTLIGGLCLFLFGMNVMGESLEKRAGSGLKTLLGFSGVGGGFALNIRGLIIFAILICIGLIRHLRGKSAPSPILMILLSAGLGIVFYGFM